MVPNLEIIWNFLILGKIGRKFKVRRRILGRRFWLNHFALGPPVFIKVELEVLQNFVYLMN